MLGVPRSVMAHYDCSFRWGTDGRLNIRFSGPDRTGERYAVCHTQYVRWNTDSEVPSVHAWTSRSFTEMEGQYVNAFLQQRCVHLEPGYVFQPNDAVLLVRECLERMREHFAEHPGRY